MRAARAYLAGVGATGALIGAAVIAFLTAAALVGFNGGLGGSEDSGDGSVRMESSDGPSTGTATVPPGGGDGGRGGPGGGPGAGPGGPGGAGGPGGGVDGSSGGAPPGTPAPAPPAPAPGSGAPGMAPGGGSGTVGAVVDQVDDTASGVGIDTGLGEAAKPITDAADQLPGSLPGGNSVPDLLGGN